MNDQFNQSNPPLPPVGEPAPEREKRPPSGSTGTTVKKRNNSESRKKASDDTVRSSTAEPNNPRSTGDRGAKSGSQTKGTGSKKERIDIAQAPPRSAKPAHRVLPFVLLGLAVFIAACLLINLFANGGVGVDNFANNPSAHPMGPVGYHLCRVLFGLFGPGVFVLPILLINMAFFWKSYIDHKLVLEKSICSLLLLILVCAMIHVFCLSQIQPTERALSAGELFLYGSKMTGGGVLGGGIGYFFVRYLNIAGGIIVSIFLVLLAGFFFIGMTPQHLLEHFRTRRSLKASSRVPLGVDDEAYIKEQMKQKHARAAGKSIPAEQPSDLPPTSAVQYAPAAKHKRSGNGLAPMPMPVLDATDESSGERPLFVPEEVDRELSEKKAAEKTARETAEKEQTAREIAGGDKPAAPSPAAPVPAPQAPAPTPESRAAQEKALNSLFPRNDAELRSVQKVQKSDRNFELKDIFINLDDDKKAPVVRKHAPLPPEVPMPESSAPKPPLPRTAPAGKPAGGAPARPAGSAPARPAGNAPARPAGAAAKPATAAPTRPAAQGEAPAKVGANRANAPAAAPVKNQPIYRQATVTAPTEFGLSNEEFEKREANIKILPRAGAKPGTAAGKPAPKKPSEAKPVLEEPASKPYIFPPISYLHQGEPMTAENRAEIDENMRKLSTTLGNFNVKVDEITYSCGPTVTRYEIFPAAGVRVRSIMNLADDIALTFAVQGVRMETIEGKSAIGVEVPNASRCTVYLRDLIDNKKFSEAKSILTAGLGADITGTSLHFDIAKMPHLLVAGTTGSGKSICINCIVMSILYRARPDEVKLVMIDPKKIEFKRYKGIPHLMAPIITESKDAAGALVAAVDEMEDRFTRIQDVGASNIDGYNKAADKDPELPHMPHIVIIIDELADLMMTARDEVEDSICRLAQKARAAGMHIIVGTQRPSVDVVTGLIKANIPSRIACTVRSQIDSRTILDFSGAEKLLGKGDMLFAPIGAMRPTRVQGAFVSDEEVEKICEFIRATNGSAVYNENFTSKMKDFSENYGKKGKSSDGEPAIPTDGTDNKYIDAIRICIEAGKVSTSLLQRRLEIGYGRAARMIDQMEQEGLVSKPNGTKPRDILITAEQFIERYVEGDAGKDAPEI